MWNEGSAMRRASSAGRLAGSSCKVMEPVASGAAACATRACGKLSLLLPPQALSSAATHTVSAGARAEEG